MTACKLRLRFAKRGDLRLVSHHDLARVLERMLRRAEIPTALTQGFNPRPKFAFTLALALGVEGRRELLEIDLAEPMETEEILRRLSSVSPRGLEWLTAECVTGSRPAQAAVVRYAVEIPVERLDLARASLSDLLASDRRTFIRRRPDRVVEFDIRPFLLDAEIAEDGAFTFRLKIDPAGSVRPEELLEVLGLGELLKCGAVLSRIDVETAP